MKDLQGNFFIPEPCSEDWNKMTPVEQGRFCAACQKCVVDFTKKSKTEIAEVFEEKGGDVCGRMRLSQMPRRMPSRRRLRIMPKKAMTQLQIFAVALFSVFSILVGGNLKAQSHQHVKGKIAYVRNDASIEGTAKWSGHAVASGIEIKLIRGEEVLAKTVSNNNGNFSFGDLRPGGYILAAYDYGNEVAYQTVNVGRKGLKNLTLVLEDLMLEGDIEYYEEPEPPVEIEPLPEPPNEATEEHTEALIMGQMAIVACEESVDEGSGPVEIVVEDTNTEAITHPVPPTEGGSASETPTQEDTAPTEVELPVPEAMEFTVFPNPAGDLVQIRRESGEASKITLRLTDLQGKFLDELEWHAEPGSEVEVDLSGLASGPYILLLHSGDRVTGKRIIKE